MASYDLKMYYQNARGLRTKTHAFRRGVLLSSYDIISLTETWLPDGLGDSELFDDRYIVWRRDRNYQLTQVKYGGGVLLATHRRLTAVERPEWHSSAEDIWVTITTKKANRRSHSNKIHICTLYLCKENLGNSFNTQLQNFSEKLSLIVSSCPNDLFLILGDFNLSNINWNGEINCLQPNGIVGESQVLFFDTLAECNLNQFNLNRNINNRILDYVLCNKYVCVSACDDPLVPEDLHHKSLDLTLTCDLDDSLETNRRLKYFYDKADYEAISSALNEVNWVMDLNNSPLDNAVDIFYAHLYNVRDKHVPHKIISSSSYPPWYSCSLKKLLKEKYKYNKRYQVYGNMADLDTFRLLRTRAKRLEQECYNNYIKRTEDAIVRQPKKFWSFVKSINRGSNSLPSKLYYEGRSADTGQGVCNLFASYFQSTFLSQLSHGNNLNYSHLNPNNVSVSISDVEISTDSILKLLNALDLTKGSGPDQIVPIFAVKYAESISVPFYLLYSACSITEGLIPRV